MSKNRSVTRTIRIPKNTADKIIELSRKRDKSFNKIFNELLNRSLDKLKEDK